jgi:hypothetical protein
MFLIELLLHGLPESLQAISATRFERTGEGGFAVPHQAPKVPDPS